VMLDTILALFVAFCLILVVEIVQAWWIHREAVEPRRAVVRLTNVAEQYEWELRHSRDRLIQIEARLEALERAFDNSKGETR
jgi:hypothetical protein